MEDIQQEKFRKENHYLSHEYQMSQMDTIINELKILKEQNYTIIIIIIWIKLKGVANKGIGNSVRNSNRTF